ncbi:MAG: transketolase family protein [Chloroflexi bacterium]|nr:transketolase family protein [Chloroflexota bacterium]
MELGKPNQDIFATTLLDLAQNDPTILVVTSDSRGSGKLVPFGQMLPNQIVEVGIAEQNLVGVSAGLASTGKKVFAVSPACFLTTRALEQIKNDVAYSNNPVRIIGISAGVSYGALGSTHHSLHDFAALRTINNIDILAPADNFETRQAVLAAMHHPRPLYFRFGKRPVYDLHAPDTIFQIGKAIRLREGRDVTFIASGETVARAMLAALHLEEAGITCRVLSMHTLKPFDSEAVIQAARETHAIITVEEHSVFGGLGEACASILMQRGLVVPFKIVGIPDEDTVTGSQSEIFDHYGISAEGLATTARTLLQVEQSS